MPTTTRPLASTNGHESLSPFQTQLDALRTEGLGPYRIAQRLHCTPAKVRWALRALPAAPHPTPKDEVRTPKVGDVGHSPEPEPSATSQADGVGPKATDVGNTFDAFQRQILALRHDGLTYRRIAERLRSTAWKVRHALSQLPADSRPNPALNVRQRRHAKVLALRQQGLTHQAIARLVGCDRSTVSGILARHATASNTSSPPSTTPTPRDIDTPVDPRTSQVLTLRRQGLSIRQIAKRLGIGASVSLVTRTLREHKSWDTPTKRGHEAAIFTLARETLPTSPTGVAIALTSDQLPQHLEALEGVVTELIAVEQVPDTFTRMLASLSRPFPLPLSLHLGDFWEIAQRLSHPIAFLDYDGMGALPADLKAHLVALAPRLASPAIIRLTCSMAHRNSLTQVPQAIQALLHVPGFQVSRLDMHSTPSRPSHTAMTTMIATLTKGDSNAPSHRHPHR